MKLKGMILIFSTMLLIASCSEVDDRGVGSGTGEVPTTIGIPNDFIILAGKSVNSLTLSWTSLASITGATIFELFKDNEKLLTLNSSDQSYVDIGLTKSTAYSYFIKASNNSSNKSTDAFSFTTLASADTIAPTTPQNLVFNPDFSSISLSWNASTDNVSVAVYEVYKDNKLIFTTGVSTLNFTDTGLAYASSFTYSILAVDGAGNKSLATVINASTLLDTQNPTTPTDLTGVTQATEVTLSWTKSTDNHSIAGYKVYRDGVELSSVATNSYVDISVAKSQTYDYQVLAFDYAGNQSVISSIFTAVTTNSNVVFRAFPSQINLNWTDSVNNNVVTYTLHRDSGNGFKPIKVTQLKGYQDVNLTENQSYNYKVTYGASNTLLPFSQTTIATTSRQFRLQVYEKSGNAIASFPVQAFIPLPYGVYGQSEQSLKDTFVLKDSSGNEINAQYWVRSRWYAKDNSIKEIVVVFKAKNIPANAGRGQSGDPLAVEYFLEHGSTPSPSAPVTVSETTNSITVSNASVNFSINKNNFNFIDSASFKGTEIINNSVSDGGYLINLYDNTYSESQPCTNKAPIIYEVEESGPIRARIRVERPAHFITNSSDGCYTTFGSTLKEPVPGFVVWFDLYHDSDRIEVNYNLLNNAITSYDNASNTKGEALDGWILFFQEMGIKFRLSANDNVYKYSANGVDQIVSSNNTKIIQTDRNTLSVNGVNSTSIGNSISALSVGSNRGVQIIDPLFEYTSPNGWQVDKTTNVLSMIVSPDGCPRCESSIGYGDTGRNSASGVKSGVKEFLPSNSGLYAVNDLSILPKKFYLSFYEGSQKLNADILKNPPNVVMSIDDYNSIGTTTDLFGIRSELIAQVEDSTNFSYDDFEPNQQLFGLNMNRIRSCTTGGIATTAYNFYMKRPPEINYLAIEMYDDLLRPQVLPKYWSGQTNITPYESRQLTNPDTVTATNGQVGYEVAAFNLLSYCKSGSIRSFDLGPEPKDFVLNGIEYEYGDKKSFQYFADKAFPNFKFVITGNTSSGGFFINRNPSAYPRDDAHMWVQQLYDAPVDNPMLEYFKRRYESYLNTYTKHKFVGGSARGVGHALIAQVDSYLESGNAETLQGINEVLDLILGRMQPSGATHKESVSGVSGKQYSISFMEGYEMHSLLNVLMSVDIGSEVYNKAYSLLFGGGVYRDQLPGLVDAAITTQFGYKDVPNCATNPLTAGRTPRCLSSSGSIVTILDPLVTAAYILKENDPVRALKIIAHVKKYLNGDFGSKPSKIKTDVASFKWNGTSTNRTANILNDMSDVSVSEWLKHIKHIEGLVK